MGDTINRQEAVDALWKALFDYEDKTEKQFIESDELDVGDWIVHRGFVQNMSDIDRQTILNLPSAQPERKPGRWIPYDDEYYECSVCGLLWVFNDGTPEENEANFCPKCGADLRGGSHVKYD